ncbi:PepSY domain-containing protein [Amycolatopsis sp. RTGN1]|uniref:PepSY domain-containing protein n=1 Tax=Amycolatopsis ponsaeliensis TaxID=2992142 RepID=UPI00254AB556|nr:PepSY domain-containing protein [Amycolatopsis sp. RTGN1]
MSSLLATTACSSPTPPAASHAVDQAEAARVATQKYGGHSLGVEQDTAQGRPSWEVEIDGSDQGRIEVDVAQATGAILTIERD